MLAYTPIKDYFIALGFIFMYYTKGVKKHGDGQEKLLKED
jgi:hypothetical protein